MTRLLRNLHAHFPQQCLKAFPVKMNIVPMHREPTLRLKLRSFGTQVADPDFIGVPAEAEVQ
jgi:hypothetical protein